MEKDGKEEKGGKGERVEGRWRREVEEVGGGKRWRREALVIKLCSCPPNPVGKEINFS